MILLLAIILTAHMAQGFVQDCLVVTLCSIIAGAGLAKDKRGLGGQLSSVVSVSIRFLLGSRNDQQCREFRKSLWRITSHPRNSFRKTSIRAILWNDYERGSDLLIKGLGKFNTKQVYQDLVDRKRQNFWMDVYEYWFDIPHLRKLWIQSFISRRSSTTAVGLITWDPLISRCNIVWPDHWESLNPQELLNHFRDEAAKHELERMPNQWFEHLKGLPDMGHLRVLRSSYDMIKAGKALSYVHEQCSIGEVYLGDLPKR